MRCHKLFIVLLRGTNFSIRLARYKPQLYVLFAVIEGRALQLQLIQIFGRIYSPFLSSRVQYAPFLPIVRTIRLKFHISHLDRILRESSHSILIKVIPVLIKLKLAILGLKNHRVKRCIHKSENKVYMSVAEQNWMDHLASVFHDVIRTYLGVSVARHLQ